MLRHPFAVYTLSELESPAHAIADTPGIPALLDTYNTQPATAIELPFPLTGNHDQNSRYEKHELGKHLHPMRPQVRRFLSRRFSIASIKNRHKKPVQVVFHGFGTRSTPCYGWKGSVTGELSVPSSADIASIEISLEGYLYLRQVGGHGGLKRLLTSRIIGGWFSPGLTCPSTIEFSTTFPTHFVEGDGTRRLLPSTFKQVLEGIPGFDVCVSYSICVVTRQSHLMPDRTSRYEKTIDYHPKAKPPRPMPPIGRCAHIITSNIVSGDRTFRPVSVKLSLPPTTTFAAKEPIPFRLRLSSESPTSITPFTCMTPSNHSFLPSSRSSIFSATASRLSLSSLSTGTSAAYSAVTLSLNRHMRPVKKTARPLIALELRRRISVTVAQGYGKGGEHYDKITVIGRSQLLDHFSGNSGRWIEYVGMICPERDIDCGAFSISHIRVQDYLVLSIDPSSTALQSLFKTSPIRLTTDSFDAPASSQAVDITEMDSILY